MDRFPMPEKLVKKAAAQRHPAWYAGEFAKA
jgi:hypothetical protein